MSRRLPLIVLCAAACAAFGPTSPVEAEDLPRGEFFETFDTDRDGRVTVSEFQGSREIFDLLDKDKDGVISPPDLGLPAEYKPKPRRARTQPGGDAGGARRGKQARPDGAGGSDRAAAMRKRLRGMDTDKDGRVSQAEFQGPPALFQRLDRNRDGYVDAEDRPKGNGGRQAATPDQIEARARKQLERMDKNGDGALSAEEVPSPRLLEAADADGNGSISADEWLAFQKKRAAAREPGSGAPRNKGDRKGKGKGKGKAGPRLSAGRLRSWDRDGNGSVSKEEFPGREAAFDRFDVNKDGVLDEADLQVGADEAPKTVPTTPPTPADPFAAQDRDGDGRLNRAEFSGTNAEWRALDKDGDGYVTRAEAAAR